MPGLPILFAIVVSLVATQAQVPRCPPNEMTDAARRAFLNTHNRYRSRLAKGLESNGNLGFAPQAANMQNMKYDCTAESSALAHARTCSGRLSDPTTRPGFKENFVEIYKIHLNLAQTARHVSMIRLFAPCLKIMRIPDHLENPAAIDDQTSNHTHSQMAWHNNVRLGCGISRCGGFSFVVCHYGPGGNNIGEYIYSVGAPCSMCPAGTVCNAVTELCESP
ncbi:SCP-like protein [Ancylostoma caninum]|uniref:SCP-like protein n=1 Tax=Ancylostoma caninum TaxID=29170 RepID=A0A368GF03_ANCCA|nr:SCP-like protein [Ancylostoma caninum]